MEVAALDLDALRGHLDETRVPYTHLDRVVFPATAERGALLKAHVVAHQIRVAERMLPYVRDRPLVFRRYAHGIDAPWFYVKDWGDEALPAFVRTVRVWTPSRATAWRWAMVDDADGLAWCAQTGAVEVNPWLSRVRDRGACATARALGSAACGADFPDLLAFDVDPWARGVKGREAGGEPGASPEDWALAVKAAYALHEVLDGLGLPSFVKTSGKRGVHVLVPVEPEHPFEVVRAFARRVAVEVAARRPDLVTLARDPAARAGKVVLDVGQNARTQTMCAPWSLRTTPQATVSVPVTWQELGDVDPLDFDVETVAARLARPDPWAGLEAARVRLADALG